MKKADEQHGMQSNAPADDCELNDVFLNPLAEREYTPPIELAIKNCDPPAADVKDASISRNGEDVCFQEHLNCNIELIVGGVRKRSLSATIRSYTAVDERDAPARRRVMTSLAMSQQGIPVNGGGLLVSYGEPFSGTGITRRQHISDGTNVPISIFLIS
ncbi:hypothetical protein Tco_0761422 [Tanacetum coccineum]